MWSRTKTGATICCTSQTDGSVREWLSERRERSGFALRLPQGKIEVTEPRKEVFIGAHARRIGFDHAIAGRQRRLRLSHTLESARREKSENRRAQAGRVLCRHQNGLVQHIGIDAIERIVALGNAATVDDAV